MSLEAVSKIVAETRAVLGKAGVAVQNDPAQQKTTEVEGNIQAIAQATGDSAVASNLKQVAKANVEALAARITKSAEELAALVKDAKGPVADEARTTIEKAGAAAAKLGEVMALFKIDGSKLRDEYDLRWKVSELVSALQQAAKLEEIIDAPAATAKTETVEKASTSEAWPRDMAGAKYDEKAGVYKSDDPTWGRDRG